MSGAREELEGPAYRVETQRLSLRCLEPRHVSLMEEAVLASLEHLRPFMDFVAREPLSFAKRLTYLRSQRGQFDLGGDYHYGIFDKAGERMLGAAALTMTGDVCEREVGYWIRADSLRQGYASEAVAALVRVAFDIEELAGLDLRLDPENIASAALAEKLGFRGPTLDPLSRPGRDGEKRDTHVYALPRVAYAESALRETPIEAYDVLGRRLL